MGYAAAQGLEHQSTRMWAQADTGAKQASMQRLGCALAADTHIAVFAFPAGVAGAGVASAKVPGRAAPVHAGVGSAGVVAFHSAGRSAHILAGHVVRAGARDCAAGGGGVLHGQGARESEAPLSTLVFGKQLFRASMLTR